MKKKRWSTWWCVAVISVVSGLLNASSTEESMLFSPTTANQADWLFVGEVMNDALERYVYFFHIHRDGTHVAAHVALFDAETKTPIVTEQGEAVITDQGMDNWHIGHAFLRFNPINASWIFGVKDSKKLGFNFKVDMLASAENRARMQTLLPGLEIVVVQTGELDGQLKISENDKEHFVTAKQTWFRQIAVVPHEGPMAPLTGLLCQSESGGGMYSMKIMDAHALRGSMAGWIDAQGKALSISQFISINQTADSSWCLHMPVPKVDWFIQNTLQQGNSIAGFIQEKPYSGFCVFNRNIFAGPTDQDVVP